MRITNREQTRSLLSARARRMASRFLCGGATTVWAASVWAQPAEAHLSTNPDFDVGFRRVEEASRLAPRAIEGRLPKSVGARPVTGHGPIGMNYGAVQAQFIDGGPHVRVWYVEEGPHAVPLADEDGNGVPDFVDLFAELSEGIAARFDDDGWRRPLSDRLRGLPDDGGDERFDVYLLDFGGSADGLFYREFCEEGRPSACGGYMAVENDFVGYGYASTEDAIRTLFSHEYAHAVGAAYADGTPSWWDEGQAVWAELAYGPVEADVRRLMARWFRTPGRPLDSPVQPGDSWPYAASAFLVASADWFGVSILQNTWERLADGSSKSATGALDVALQQVGSSLDAAWSRFAAASWFTGARASAAPDALSIRWGSTFESLKTEPLVLTSMPQRIEVPKWSVQAATLTSVAGDVFVQALGCDDMPAASLTLVSSDARSATPLILGEPARWPRDAALVIGGKTRDGALQCVQLSLVDAPTEPACEEPSCGPSACDTDPCDVGGRDGGEGCSQSGGASALWWHAGLLGIVAVWTRRRRLHSV